MNRIASGSELQTFWGDEMEKIKVFLGDSRVVFREGMHFILDSEEDVEVVGEGRTDEEALAFLQKQTVDVIVLSQDMRNVARRITEAYPSAGLIFIGDTPPRQQGVIGNSIFLTRDMNPEELAYAVRKVTWNGSRAQTWNGTDRTKKLKQSSRGRLLSMLDALWRPK